MKRLTFMRTKAGNGFKVCVGDEWYYTCDKFLLQVIERTKRSCQFRTLKEDEPNEPSSSAISEQDESCELDVFD